MITFFQRTPVAIWPTSTRARILGPMGVGRRSLLALLTLLATLTRADLPKRYDLPPLPDTPQNALVRTPEEVSAAGLAVLAAYSAPPIAALGYLDVTKAPYSARGDGAADDTVALQRALTDARDARLVVWLPAGTYLVRNTLQCVQGAINMRARPTGPRLPAEERFRADDHPCVIQGPGGPDRAVIRLAANAPGFGDPTQPRPVLCGWARRWTPPYDLQPNVSFNQMLVSIDFDVRDHPGAIAVDWQGAQGTAVQDVRIDARGAFAGVRGLTGSGGSTHQLTVRGGRFGVLAAGIGGFSGFTGSQPSPLLAAATLIGQTEAAIYYAGRGPLTVVGAKIEGAGIVCAAKGPDYDGAVTVIDCSLDVPTGPVIRANRPVYVANTFVRTAATLVRFPATDVPGGGSRGWAHVREFAGAPPGPFPIWLEGRRHDGIVRDLIDSAAAPPADLQTRHALPPLPAWNMPGVVNAAAAPYRASGDNATDAAPAIQRALDEHPVVFLPKGRYRLSRPLVLPPGRKLIGAGRTFTVLLAMREAPAFAGSVEPQPLVETADASSADTMLALLELRPASPGSYALRWRSGAQSVVRDVNFRLSGAQAHGGLVRIEGSGGGRWFNFFNGQSTRGAADYRQLLVRGTRQPLVFYGFNPEHARSEVMTEFVDARDVTIFALKGETYEIGNPATGTRPLLRVRDSQQIRLFSGGGICGAAEGNLPCIYQMENTSEFLLANLGHQTTALFGPPGTWSMLADRGPAAEVGTPGHEYLTLYRRR